MAEKEGVVETEADRLIELLKTTDEISVTNAAKRLNADPKTIEAIATLLEEEDLLKIVYKLTTPYLIPIKEAVNKIETAASAPVQWETPQPEIPEQQPAVQQEAQERLDELYAQSKELMKQKKYGEL